MIKQFVFVIAKGTKYHCLYYAFRSSDVLCAEPLLDSIVVKYNKTVKVTSFVAGNPRCQTSDVNMYK